MPRPLAKAAWATVVVVAAVVGLVALLAACTSSPAAAACVPKYADTGMGMLARSPAALFGLTLQATVASAVASSPETVQAAFSLTQAAAAVSTPVTMPAVNSTLFAKAAAVNNASTHRHLAAQQVGSWTDLKDEIAGGSSPGSFIFSTNFNCNYDAQIQINGEVIVDGAGAICDAGQAGRFFYVNSGGNFTLKSITLKNGMIDVRGWSCLSCLCTIFETSETSVELFLYIAVFIVQCRELTCPCPPM